MVLTKLTLYAIKTLARIWGFSLTRKPSILQPNYCIISAPTCIFCFIKKAFLIAFYPLKISHTNITKKHLILIIRLLIRFLILVEQTKNEKKFQ